VVLKKATELLGLVFLHQVSGVANELERAADDLLGQL